MLQWTDEAVDQLLDRSAVSEEAATAGGGDGVKGGGAAAGGNALGSLLQTFKVTRQSNGVACIVGDDVSRMIQVLDTVGKNGDYRFVGWVTSYRVV